MSVRIACRSNDQRGTLDASQTVLHSIAIHHPVAFRRHLAGPQGVNHEAPQQIGIISGIERLPARPELGEMGAVGACLDVIDHPHGVMFGPARRIDERTGREHQRADARRPRRGQFHRDRRTGVMADDGSARHFQRIEPAA